MMPRDKSWMFHLYFYRTYKHKIWYSGDLGLEISTLQVKSPFDRIVTWFRFTKWKSCGHIVTNKKRFFSSSTRSFTNKLDWVVTKSYVYSTVKINDPFLTGSFEVAWQTENVSPFPKIPWPLKNWDKDSDFYSTRL